MNKLVTMGVMALAALSVVGCGYDSSTAPSPSAAPKFTATLLAANEIPAAAAVDSGGTGTATITFNLTKDSS